MIIYRFKTFCNNINNYEKAQKIHIDLLYYKFTVTVNRAYYVLEIIRTFYYNNIFLKILAN